MGICRIEMVSAWFTIEVEETYLCMHGGKHKGGKRDCRDCVGLSEKSALTFEKSTLMFEKSTSMSLT